jgi:hypothetical protein
LADCANLPALTRRAYDAAKHDVAVKRYGEKARGEEAQDQRTTLHRAAIDALTIFPGHSHE